MSSHSTHIATIDLIHLTPEPPPESSGLALTRAEPAYVLPQPAGPRCATKPGRNRHRAGPPAGAACRRRRSGRSWADDADPVLPGRRHGIGLPGAFHQPEPHNLQVAVVGSTPQAKVFAQTLKDQAGSALDVRTVADNAAARR